MLRCKDVVHAVTSRGLESMPFGRRAAIRLHLAMCKHCRAYVRSLKRLRAAARAVWYEVVPIGAGRLDRITNWLESRPAIEPGPENRH